MQNVSDDFPGYITNVRGCGLFCAFDFPSDIERNKFISKAFEKKLMILGSGDNSIRFRPHLNVLKEDLDISLDIIHSTVKDMLN